MIRLVKCSLFLSLALLLSACAGGSEGNSPLSAVFPDQTGAAEASYFSCGVTTDWAMTAEELGDLETWALDLDLTEQSFPAGETPGDRDGGSGYTFRLGGNSFSYILTGEESYILLGDAWHHVKNPSDPPVSIPGAPSLKAEDMEQLEAYHFIVPADAEKKTVTDTAPIQEVLDLLERASAADTPPEALAGGAVVSFRLTLASGEIREWICTEAADGLWAVTGAEGSYETMIDCAALWDSLPGEAAAADEGELPVFP